MKNITGIQEKFTFIVSSEMTAMFGTDEIHPVLSTFWLSYFFEWFSRKIIEQHFEHDENACGSELSIKHISPAFVGENVSVSVKVESMVKSKIFCSLEAKVNHRIIATGTTTQYLSTNQFFNDQFRKGKTNG